MYKRQEQYIPYLRAHDLTSYLHVYKDICVMVEKLVEEKCLDSSDSVSYTHLDVYKRQIKGWISLLAAEIQMPSLSGLVLSNLL